MAELPLTTEALVMESLQSSPETGALSRMIGDASTLIRGETRRRFTVHGSPTTAERPVENRAMSVRPGGFVYADELLSLEDLEYVADPSGSRLYVEATLDDYDTPKGMHVALASPESMDPLTPRDNRDNFVRNLPFSDGGGLSREAGYQTPRYPAWVTVRGRFGYTRVLDNTGAVVVSTVPEEIEYLTRRTVVIWDRGENQQFVEFAETAQGTVVTPEKLPTAVLRALEPWVAPREVLL